MPTPFPLTPPYAARTLLPTLGRAQRKRTCPEITCPKSLAYPVAPAPPPVGRPLLPTLSSAAALLKLVICSARRHFLRCAHQSLRVLRHSCRQRRKRPLPSNPFVPFRAHTGSHARTPALRWAQLTPSPCHRRRRRRARDGELDQVPFLSLLTLHFPSGKALLPSRALATKSRGDPPVNARLSGGPFHWEI